MKRKLVTLAAIAALGMVAPVSFAAAQAPVQAPVQAPAPAYSATQAGPTVSNAAVGIQRTSTANAAAPMQEARLGAGRNVALMVVGGAALIIGAAIGGTAGILIAVTGAAVGLYGLYNFIQ
ncbi:MAG: hypothetical protein ACSLFK_07995 [Gemmatimonadaceae bacterium]